MTNLRFKIFKKKDLKKIYSITSLVFVFGYMFFTYPSVLPLILPVPGEIAMAIIMVCLFSLLLFLKSKIKVLPSCINFIVTVQIIVWMCYFYIHRDSSYITRIVYIGLAYLSILCIYNSVGGLKKFIRSYDIILLSLGYCGVFTFFIVAITSMEPLIIYQNLDTRPGYWYGLSATNATILNFIRYSGIFDEPGAMAYWGMFAILFNKLYIKNKKIEIGLIITLSFTFSMAYYIQLFFYLCFYYIKSKKVFISFILMAAILCTGIYSLKDGEYAAIYKLTVSRFEQDDDGDLKGDTRSKMMYKAKTQFLLNPIVGTGATKLAQMDYMGDNPFENLAADGIIGTITMYLPLILLFPLAQKKKELMFAIIILILGYFQRPYHTNYYHPLILYVFFLIAAKKSENKQLYYY